jgi:hypothetical protein
MGAILSRRKGKKRSERAASSRSDNHPIASVPQPGSLDSLPVIPDEGRLSVDPLPPRRASETDAQSDHERSGEEEEEEQEETSAPISRRPTKRRSRRRKKKGKPTRLLSSVCIPSFVPMIAIVNVVGTVIHTSLLLSCFPLISNDTHQHQHLG